MLITQSILEDPMLFLWSLQALGIHVVHVHNASKTLIHIK